MPAQFESAARRASASPIRHVVVVIQENRSFDDLFARFPGATGARRGKRSDGRTVALKEVTLIGSDITHTHGSFETEYDGGKLDGFDKVLYGADQTGTYPYQYVDPALIAEYWTLAREYVLADHMFQTQGSGSYTAHQDLIAGGTAISSTESVIDDPSALPWGCDAPPGTVTSLIDSSGVEYPGAGPFPCFTRATLRDLLDAKHVSWRYYTPNEPGGGDIWNAFDSVQQVREGPQWTKNVSTPETNVLADAEKGRLPDVAWVVPDYWNSDHLGNKHDTGPSWVAGVVNAIGQSRAWNSTAIVVVWDDWGGLYDNVKPPQIRYDGLGFRVPCLIVSPYARKGYVDHTQYEFGSILRFIEDNWSLGRLGTTDATANSIADAFDFTQPPRAFVPLHARYSRASLLRQGHSDEPVDRQ
ncbi:MAG TPA: alkaline phosphatase family protein [Candidatus Acidoferrales bacterium]|nr:alkaline phosphatase family protein [Candidatus Acidoferrales bacterium]